MNQSIRISIAGCILLCFGLVGCVLTNPSTVSTSTLIPTDSTLTTTTSSATTSEFTTSASLSSSQSSTLSSTISFVTRTVTITQETTSRITTTVPITTATRTTIDMACAEEVFEPDETEYERITNVIGQFVWFQPLVQLGDVLCLNVAEQVKDANITYDRYLLSSSNPSVATVQNNIVTVVGSGTTEIRIAFFDSSVPLMTVSILGTLRAIDPSEWIEITTAEELAAIAQNKSGAYILKANIDLSSYGEWNPIGGPPMGNQFTGVFINPDGYVISNLRISSASSVTESPNGGVNGGLFGSIIEAYIDGILLENVYIDVSDDQDEWATSIAGGIAGSVSKSVIRNCYVSGYVIAQYFAGGIAGSNDWSLYEHNYFWGEVILQNGPLPNREMGAGGIVGFSHTRYQDGGIVDCHVFGTVSGNAHTGGIVGSYVGERFVGNTFEGTVIGAGSVDPLIGFDRNANLS